MKSNTILVSLIAILAVITLTAFVSATAPTIGGSLDVTILTTVNGVNAADATLNIADSTGDTIPIRVDVLSGSANVTDVTVKVELADNEASTGEFDVYTGNQYTNLLAIKLPENLKDSPSKTYRLLVTVKAGNGAYRTYDYPIVVQRQSYNLEILSVDVAKSATAGSTINVDVVVKNRGSHSLDDTFVVVRIPSLDIEKKSYFSDLTPVDQASPDKQDAAEGIISLKIPSDAKAGIYDLEVEAFNSDSDVKTVKRITVSGMEQGSDVLVSATSQDIAAGSTATYDLILVNSGNRIAVYNIVPESAQNLIVSVDEPIVTIPADSSKVVKVNVKAGNVMGTFNFAVNVNSQGQLVKKVNLAANVVKSGITGNSNVIVLTVVLAIVFIVLLVVLIVLLTRKPAKSEEFEESYY